MHVDVRTILLIIELLCFVISAIDITTVKWDRFIAAGLAFATLAMLVG